MPSPFDPANDIAYQQWRNVKLQNAPTKNNSIDDLFVTIADCNNPSQKEVNQLAQNCQQNSLCLYRLNDHKDNTKKCVINLAKHLGMKNLDANICADKDNLTSITQISHKDQHEYIPYSNKRLSWHTDGYYNTPQNKIHSMLLHCEQAAKSGGESLLMDHEIAYILLRDENPDYIKAFMQDDAMTIPANVLNGKIIRKAQTGPIFSTNTTGQLHMRYSARKRNIEWKQTPPILEAVAFLEDLFESDSPYILTHTLQAGEGLICRNVLHRRTSFVDYEDTDKKRLLYRGRYFDPILQP